MTGESGDSDQARENPVTIRREVLDPGSGAHFVVAASNDSRVRVHGGIPGERVQVRLETDDPSWARIVGWDHVSSDRRDPPCPYASACGGCHWLSIDEKRQQAIRRERLFALCAAHGIDLSTAAITEIPSRDAIAYRYRARLQIDGTVRPARIGFHGDRDWTIVDATACAMFAPPLARAYESVRRLILSDETDAIADLTGAEIVALEGSVGALVYLNPRDRAPAAWPQLGEQWLTRGGAALAGVAVRVPRGDARPAVLGCPAIVGRAPRGMPVAAAARGFVQANLGCAERLARAIADRIVGLLPSPRVMELFAGSGLFGWAVADVGADVRGVEWDEAAVAAAQLLPPPRLGRFRCESGDSRRAALNDCDLLLTDAPRAGLGRLAHSIVEHGPSWVVLISCYAETLVRDLTVLVSGGYELKELWLADFYPQTQHLESVVFLQRSISGASAR
ncbi:MAG: hypothetical protein U0V87_02095 [Acidobacteriota bacterium]